MKTTRIKHHISVDVWTNRFLGTVERAQRLLELLKYFDGGIWIPEKWNIYEPIRKPFMKENEEEIIKECIKDDPPGSGNAYNGLLFYRKKPRTWSMLHIQRWGKAKLNYLHMELDGNEFVEENGPDRLKNILHEFIIWSDGVFGSVYYSGQAHTRIVQMTPLERLDQAYWLMFFGQPYLDMFGTDRVLQAPVYSVTGLDGHGVFLQAAPRFDSPEMTESPDLLIGLEEYLGADAFAGRGYPQIPCRVPKFDLSETTPYTPNPYRETPLNKSRSAMSGKPDSDSLLSAVIPFAQQLLGKHSEFYPFGAGMSVDGKIDLLQTMSDSNHPDSQQLIDLTYSGITHLANEGRIRGAAVCYDARVVPPGTSEKVDAICIELHHLSEGCAKVFMPYRKGKGGSIKYDPLFGVPLESRVFSVTGAVQ